VQDSYRIRLPTEKELEMKVSKTVKKTRYYESTLLSAYKVATLSFDYI
jgi:nucleolar complex protein 3